MITLRQTAFLTTCKTQAPVMQILLVQPPFRDFYSTPIRSQPIGLAYVAAALRAHGHQVRILDCRTERKRSVPIPRELSGLQEYYPFNDRSPFKLYSGFYHFGMSREEVRGALEHFPADVVGISSSFTPYHEEAVEIARMVKEQDPRKMVVMGGAHVSCDPAGVLQSPFVDYVVLGEGEGRFVSLVEQIERGCTGAPDWIDGIGYRKGGMIRIAPLQSFIADLDALPYPARDLLEAARYRIKNKYSTMIITSRGCPQRCAYCSTHRVMGGQFRARSPESVVEEIRDCRERLGIEVFDIEDDNVTYDRGRAQRLLQLIINSFGAGTLDLSAMNGISFTALDAELLRLMKRAGFQTINLSLVSTATGTTERMGRPGKSSDFATILAVAEQVGLQVIAYAILGMPDQTIEEMVDTLIYLMGKQVLIGPSIFYPTPGTPLFDRCQRDGILPPHPSQWRSSAFPIETRNCSRLDLATLFRLARVINFIKKQMNEQVMDEGITCREVCRTLKERALPAQGERTPWPAMLLALFEERRCCCLYSGRNGSMDIRRAPTSSKVIDCFLEKGWERPIRKSAP